MLEPLCRKICINRNFFFEILVDSNHFFSKWNAPKHPTAKRFEEMTHQKKLKKKFNNPCS